MSSGGRPGLEFFLQDALTLAPKLLGCTLHHVTQEGEHLAGRIVETEAYPGGEDRASHTFGGRRTKRNEVMYSAGGHAYLYFVYGMHTCFNVVSGEEGDGEAVLVRALEPVLGIHVMERNRKVEEATKLCSGPGKLCQALGLALDSNGENLCESSRIWIEAGDVADTETLVCTPRIGVGYAAEWAVFPYRYVIPESSHLSTRNGLKAEKSRL
ncbi:MAG: DNA-3-methyladenine glycosylase [Planctomycetota bacterium]